MAQFTYKARSRSGEVMQGLLESADRAAAMSQLKRDGLFPVSIEPAKGKAVKQAAKAERAAKAQNAPKPINENARSGFSFRRGKNRKPKLQESATWLLQLANLLRSGMPLTLALNRASSPLNARTTSLVPPVQGVSLSTPSEKLACSYADSAR